MKFWLVIGLLSLNAFGADRSVIYHACTESESFTISSSLPKQTRNSLDDLLSLALKKNPDLKKAVQAMDVSVALMKEKDTEVKSLAGYGVARLYLSMGYPHLSRRLLETLIKKHKAFKTPEERKVGLAMVGCLNEIHKKSSAMTNDLAILDSLENWSNGAPVEELEVIQEAEFHLFQQELRTTKNLSLSHYGALAKGSSAWTKLTKGVLAIKQRDLKTGINELKGFLRGPRSAAISPTVDLAKLLLARAFAENGDRSKADAVLRSIPATSNLLPEAITDRGELLSRAGKYSNAADVLMNLQLGPMARTFEPEGQVELARVLTKLCQYPAAFRVLGAFTEHYGPVRLSLEKYTEDKGDAPLYRRLKGFLAKGDKMAPEERVIALEWIRNGEFIAAQQEINLILSERDASLKHEQDMQVLKDRSELGAGSKAFLSSLQKFRSTLGAREKVLVANMERELKDKTKVMKAKLLRAEERAALLDADVMRLAGADLAQEKVSATKKVDNNPTSGPTLLNWGRVPASDLEKHEVWADELGSLKALIADNCHGE